MCGHELHNSQVKSFLLKCTLIFAEVLRGGGSSPGSTTSDVLAAEPKEPHFFSSLHIQGFLGMTTFILVGM